MWFKLNETSGTTAHDSSSHHYDVTLDGVTWNSGTIFDGSTCGSVVVDPKFRDPPITITAWTTPTLRDDENINDYALTPFPPNAVSGDTPGLGGYGVGVDVWNGGAIVSVETGSVAAIAFHALTAPVSVNVESFVALVVPNGATASVYVDGGLLQSTTASDPPAVSSPQFHIGCHNDDTGYGSKRFYRGRMRDARIHNRALDAAEVMTLFATGPVTL